MIHVRQSGTTTVYPPATDCRYSTVTWAELHRTNIHPYTYFLHLHIVFPQQGNAADDFRFQHYKTTFKIALKNKLYEELMLIIQLTFCYSPSDRDLYPPPPVVSAQWSHVSFPLWPLTTV